MTEVELLRARVAELEADLKAQLCIDATLVSNNDDLRAQNAALVEALAVLVDRYDIRDVPLRSEIDAARAALALVKP